MKSQDWFSKVNNAKKQHKRLTWVSINIGILKRSEKQLYLKPVRGKRVAIKVNTNESYNNTTMYDNMDNKEEKANDLVDEVALVNPFTNVKENIEDNYAKKTKYESTDQNPGTSNSIALCSKNFVENANRFVEETPAIC